MGEEAPVVVQGSFNLELQGSQTAVTIDNKIYIVGEFSDDRNTVKIFHKLTGTWTTPDVLGTQPNLSKFHSVTTLNDGQRVLVIKKETVLSDSFWFLEVNTPFIKERNKVYGSNVVAWSKGIVGDSPKPIVISGPSGVGKGTLIEKLMKDYPSTFGFSVSHTTRAPREKEINGVHYHFTEMSKMEKEISEGKFLENALVHGNRYGTSIEAVEAVSDAGKRCILDIDVQGARSVRASALDAIFIFVCPPSFEELERRLRARGTETEEQIQKRLRNARTELDQAEAPGLFDHLLVNDDLNACYQKLKKLLSLSEDVSAPKECIPEELGSSVCLAVKPRSDSAVLLELVTSNANADNTLVLDLSSLKGGAPGRTRGLKISAK